MDKNEWILKIMQDKEFCRLETERLSEGADFSEALTGQIHEGIFLALISKAKDKNLARFLSEYSLFATADEITPKVFDALLKCKTSYRESILIGLCHCDLSFYQLQELNERYLDLEVWLKMIARCLKSDAFSQYDLSEFLKSGKNYHENIQENLQYFLQTFPMEEVTLEKKEVLRKFFSNKEQ